MVGEYQHNGNHGESITAVAEVQGTLAVGDSRGKIVLVYNYFANLIKNKQPKDKNSKSSTSNNNNNNYTAVLEWHTGPVLTLVANGHYLYSAG